MGVGIAFEPLNRYETSLLNTVEEGLSFIEKINSKSLGMLLDTFHMNIEKPSIEKSMCLAGDRIFHFHYADSNRNYPGHGHLDFKSVMRTLVDIGYQGFVSGEHRAYPDPLMAAERGLAYLKELETQLFQTNGQGGDI
jgi:sugar phosphate isomerase/epimerase